MYPKITRARTALALGAVAMLALPAIAGASAHHHPYGKYHGNGAGSNQPVRLSVLTPGPGDTASSAFNIAVSYQAKNQRGNQALSGYQTQFIDPTGPDGKANPAFGPGHSSVAPGLVVTMSTTPDKAGGPSENLAGVFQINGVTSNRGLTKVLNDWQVSSPGFFGQNTDATITAYIVNGTAPDSVPAGGLTPISNVVHETFHIGS
jgi:hypothetical protein